MIPTPLNHNTTFLHNVHRKCKHCSILYPITWNFHTYFKLKLKFQNVRFQRYYRIIKVTCNSSIRPVNVIAQNALPTEMKAEQKHHGRIRYCLVGDECQPLNSWTFCVNPIILFSLGCKQIVKKIIYCILLWSIYNDICCDCHHLNGSHCLISWMFWWGHMYLSNLWYWYNCIWKSLNNDKKNMKVGQVSIFNCWLAQRDPIFSLNHLDNVYLYI